MKRIIAIVLLVAVPAIAQAETFTFRSENKGGVQVQAPSATPGGRASGGGTFSVSTVATDANGKKLTATADCIQWILPAGDRFGSSSVCKYTAAPGDTYVSSFSCDMPGPASQCFGRLTGTGGQYKGRNGAFAFHNGPGSAGTGFWDETPPAK